MCEPLQMATTLLGNFIRWSWERFQYGLATTQTNRYVCSKLPGSRKRWSGERWKRLLVVSSYSHTVLSLVCCSCAAPKHTTTRHKRNIRIPVIGIQWSLESKFTKASFCTNSECIYVCLVTRCYMYIVRSFIVLCPYHTRAQFFVFLFGQNKKRGERQQRWDFSLSFVTIAWLRYLRVLSTLDRLMYTKFNNCSYNAPSHLNPCLRANKFWSAE